MGAIAEVGGPAPTPASSPSPLGAPTPEELHPLDTDAYVARSGVCDSSSYQNLGWSGMTKQQCVDRARESLSCDYLSYAPSFNNGQTGCFCFAAQHCQNTKFKIDGQWVTWK